MLVTDVWEALEYTNREPPAHLLLRPVAEFFGYKFAEVATKGKKTNKNLATPAQVEPMFAIGGRPKPKETLPAHIRNSPTFKKMFSDMEKDDAG